MNTTVEYYRSLQEKILETFEEGRAVYRDAGLTDEQIDTNRIDYAWNLKQEHITKLLEIKERQRILAQQAMSIYNELKGSKFEVPRPVIPVWVREEAYRRRKQREKLM